MNTVALHEETSSRVKKTPEILLVSTGGTIDKTYFDKLSLYEVGEAAINKILAKLPNTEAMNYVELCRKDSLEINDNDRQALLELINSRPEKKVLVTHGTDSMAETARYLALRTDKLVVLCGAFLPAAFTDSDADLNVGSALAALSLLQSGVYIAMHGKVLAAETAKKNYQSRSFEAI
ncbi:asparaginase domain-containing protein [Agaribacterium haliotis]|uniref:asparaginase domain-containing protein n=1 Tax=Agaribacterium haliotis TaxID=2013869 RepID=UPI000BB589AA|nr:asparaginase domain-containing protein [Agaribacterium haliotis]